MLPCNSSNEDSPSKDTKLTEHSIPEGQMAQGKHSQRGAGVLGSFSTHASTILHDSKLFIHSTSKSLFTYLWNSYPPARNFS